jgi:hypothetical protein
MAALNPEGVDPPRAVRRAAGFQRHPRNGAPYVNHPFKLTQKEKPARVMYGRPSNFGAQVENRFNLERWSERRVLFGAALLDDLDSLVGCDIDDPEVTDRLDGMVLEAKTRAGARLAAQRGTLTHEFTEYVDRHEGSPLSALEYAEELGIPNKAVTAVMDVYGRTIGAYDIQTQYIEQTVVDDRWRLAGTLDRVSLLGQDLMFQDGTVVEAGTYVILDIKTGRIKLDRNGVPDYWHSYAVQIASYSHSLPYFIAEDSWDEYREEWPFEISQRHGLILHLDIGNAVEEGVATARLFHVDLDEGHRAGDLCRKARDWQSMNGIVQPLAAPPLAVNV